MDPTQCVTEAIRKVFRSNFHPQLLHELEVLLAELQNTTLLRKALARFLHQETRVRGHFSVLYDCFVACMRNSEKTSDPQVQG